LRGVSGAVLCYGQTSAGKTFTMEGEELTGAGAAAGELRGIIPRSLISLFGAAQAEKDAGRGSYRFTLSMLEIYMERLRDLLDPDSGAELRIVEDRTRGVVIRGLREVVVDSIEMALEVFLCGREHRAVGATGMNDLSSRSHSIFMLKA
jgi:kinesin family protein 5